MVKREVRSDAGHAVARLAPVTLELQEDFRRLVGLLEADLDGLGVATRERLREALPDWMTKAIFSEEEVVAFIHASLSAQLYGFRTGTFPGRSSDLEAIVVQVVAEVGDLKLLLNGSRIVQIVLSEAWFELVEQSIERSDDRRQLQRHGSEYFSRYAGQLCDYATDIYQREIEQSARSGEQRRVHAIRALLEGGSLVGAQIDVNLEQHHIGIVAWGEGGAEAPRELASALGRPLLTIGPLNRNWWGWISGSRALDPAQEAALKRFRPAGSARLAIGLEGFGEAGFRATNRQALRARWIARNSDDAVVHYGDVAVEALASENGEDARAFVAHELRGIDDDSSTSQRIRETIVAYFAADHNAASAAASLGIHHQTVANRLRVAEERLGHPVGGRRVELETALRLRLCLGREAA
ncbi:MAG TPA: helix-turn-helix domain-containing protein [Solirubrobacterales bacterium]|nr:helix-turn-helix domain-containing protein [Solirubrobacterales bacterium]